MKKFLLISLIFLSSLLFSQTDTKFWFAAPDVTSGHGAGGGFDGGEPILFRISTMNLPSTVTISQPANPGFVPIVINIPANAQFSQDLTPFIGNVENTPANTILNYGFYIESTNLITVYYEVNTGYNPDIFALKGKNALGTEFYTPFQNYWSNGDPYTPKPYSEFVIVATEDNTLLTITPANDIIGHAADVPFNIVLNRGQSYSCRAVSQAAALHLGGSKIVASKPIAVTICDDSMGWETCFDIMGDQIVPTDIIGTEYIVMKGQVWNMEQCFILAIQDGTEIYIDGAALPVATLNEGETYAHVLTANTTHIRSTNATYCLHIAGFGCELGGAILPPTNQCTGSTQVGFTRSTNQRFFLNLMVRTGAEDGFILNGNGPNTIIPAADFQPIAGNPDWMATDFEFTLGGAIPVGVASLIQNTKDIFHIGIINGENNRGCRYGYFSDFNALVIDAVVTNTESDVIKVCYGECVQLMATGGTNYIWSNGSTLSDPSNQFPVACPLETTKYTVTVSGACNMTDSAAVNVLVAMPLHAEFTIDKNFGCSPFTVNISNSSLGASDFEWTFGNGDTSFVSDANLSYTYTNLTATPQSFDIQLVVKNAFDCYDSLVKTIIVYPEVSAGFVADPLLGCSPLDVSFSNISTGANSYFWDFGDGSSSSDISPFHNFNNNETSNIIYNIQLIAYSEFLCTDTANQTIEVFPLVQALFTNQIASGCSPLNVEIINESIAADSYSWDFGNGNISTDEGPVFNQQYLNSGDLPLDFTITLVTENISGCVDSLERIITVYPTINTQFSVSNNMGCSPLSVQFTNETFPSGNYIWEFGDGGSSADDSPEHVFENNSLNDTIFTVELIAITEFMCSDTITSEILVHPYINALFTFEYSSGCSPFNVVFNNQSFGVDFYSWDFGNGLISDTSATDFNLLYVNSGTVPEYYTIALNVENAAGCTDSITRLLTIFPEVTSSFTVDFEEGCNPLEVNFSNFSENANQYTWTFGDGGSMGSFEGSHTFENMSLNDTVFTIYMVAQSEFLCTDTSSIEITVYSFLKADFTFENSFGCSPFNLEIYNNSIGASEYYWDWGDGTIGNSSDEIMFQDYNNESDEPEEYTIQLTVLNEHGCIDSIDRQLTVFPLVTAAFTADTLSGCHPLPVNFANESIGANYYIWEYGDGGSSSDENPSHIFQNFILSDTNYSISLIAISEYYCKDTTSLEILVFPYIFANFTIENTFACSPFEIEIINGSIGADIYNWDFGTGEFSDSDSDTLTYNYINNEDVAISYPILLNVENIYGCKDSLSRTITIYPEVIAAFIQDTTSGCNPVTVNFENQSENANSYYWDFGDGTGSLASNPSHIFINSTLTDTVYLVSLIASSSYLCSDSAQIAIEVFAQPDAFFTVSEFSGCSPFEIDITNQSEGATDFIWNFGDGTIISSTELTGTYTYHNTTNHPVAYELQLIAQNSAGCETQFSVTIMVYPNVEASFTNEPEGCSPFSAAFINNSTGASSYNWDFGNGTFSESVHPVSLFTSGNGIDTIYNIELVAVSNYGCSDVAYGQIVVYPVPEVNFLVDPVIQVYPSSTVYINNETGGTWNYNWTFGDSQTSSSPEPGYHTYMSWGIYNITLTAYSVHCSDSISKTIQIVTPNPTASFVTGANEGCMPVTIVFESTASYANLYLWEFGDGGTSSLHNPSHTYYNSGTYIVKLTVTGDGGIATAYDTIVVHPLPTANFAVAPSLVTIPLQSAFFNNLSDLGEAYLWDFGDGNTSQEYSPTHTYSNEGQYNVQLSVWSEYGCFDSIFIKNAVEAVTNCVLIFPDAFTPTGLRGGSYSFSDRNNDVFHPHHMEVDEYLLQIFNRWGELIFETDDIRTGWDGYYRDVFCKQDVYVWKVRAVCTNGKLIINAGDVTLYR
jgi:gliding motility-associated-like protein